MIPRTLRTSPFVHSDCTCHTLCPRQKCKVPEEEAGSLINNRNTFGSQNGLKLFTFTETSAEKSLMYIVSNL